MPNEVSFYRQRADFAKDESSLEVFEKLNYPWVKEAKEEMRCTIKRAIKNLYDEAVKCDCVHLLSDRGMYKQFKLNELYEEEFANVILSKFLWLKMDIKLAYLTIGKFLITEHEIEMLRYFYDHPTKKTLNRKAFRIEKWFSSALIGQCKPKYLTFSVRGIDYFETRKLSFNEVFGDYARSWRVLDEIFGGLLDNGYYHANGVDNFISYLRKPMLYDSGYISEKDFDEGVAEKKRRHEYAVQCLAELAKKYSNPYCLETGELLKEWYLSGSNKKMSFEDFLEKNRSACYNEYSAALKML